MTTPAPQPSSWIRRFTHLIPAGTQVLDVACGSGRHMRWLAQQGYQPLGVDRNPDSLQLAAQWGDTVQADLEDGSPWPLPDRQFGGVVVTNYLWRALFPQLFASVQPGGVLLYETFADGNASVGRPSSPEFLLQPGELLQQLAKAGPGWRVIAYEDGFLGDPDRFVQRIAAVREAASEQPVRYPL
ncbi:class I SAM-dependent methyltransferase [Brachymonas sp. J145]|uniref:class I SAM-dependent methyltransferase n=1 Tax=Brachymonas sp. J145 TaxID=3116489 RepID=UPI002E780CE7|nr:class I SAM-dependent methyltransferase [Brachymonas sp. J145]MEE1654332.1 class I SAM-dependent methyltransferase [Brachymonas sp. J145]